MPCEAEADISRTATIRHATYRRAVVSARTRGDASMTTTLLLVSLFLSRPLYWALDGAMGALGAAATVQVGVLVVAVAARRTGDVPLLAADEETRLSTRGILAAAGVGVGLFVLTLPIYAVMARLVGSAPAALRPHDTTGWVLAGGTALAAAVGEEIAFRGALWTRWRSRLGDRGAVFATSLAFGAYHMDPLQLLPTFVLGVGLVLLVRRQRHLAGSMVAHLVFNALGFGLLASMPA